MTKWHAHVAHMAKHMNMAPFPPKSGADVAIIYPSTKISAGCRLALF